MIPVVTPAEMNAIDRAAPEQLDVLIGRAGAAVFHAAVRMLAGTYGRRVVVIAGKGNNGNDGREAARRLRARGVRVIELDAAALPERLPACDLVIDAAYGTGFSGTFEPPQPPPGTPVLAVDIPSGVDGLTGAVGGAPLRADRTVTFAAAKPGLLLQPGASFVGTLEVADIGLDVSSSTTRVLEASDVAAWLPVRSPGAHKWQSAVWVVAGSPGMEGAAHLVCRGAQRAGAGYVRLSRPGTTGPARVEVPAEVVETPLEREWARTVLHGTERFGALVVGNGLGTDLDTQQQVRHLAAHVAVPLVLDADGVTALGHQPTDLVGPQTILTPHDGEFARLTGAAPGPDRIAAVRALSASTRAVVLLKGPATIVAEPAGQVLVVAAGDARLATAGTGDVLAGVIGALCAQGLAPFRAAAVGAFIHGRAGALGWQHGLVAGDVAALLPTVLDALAAGAETAG